MEESTAPELKSADKAEKESGKSEEHTVHVDNKNDMSEGEAQEDGSDDQSKNQLLAHDDSSRSEDEIALSAVQEDRPHCRRKQEMRRRAFRSSKALFLRMALTKIPIHQPDVLFGCFKPTTINIPSSDAMTSWLARLISTMLHT